MLYEELKHIQAILEAMLDVKNERKDECTQTEEKPEMIASETQTKEDAQNKTLDDVAYDENETEGTNAEEEMVEEDMVYVKTDYLAELVAQNKVLKEDIDKKCEHIDKLKNMLNIEKTNNIKLLSENMDLRAKNTELKRKHKKSPALKPHYSASEDEKQFIYLLNRKL